jgi:hypothetical protein
MAASAKVERHRGSTGFGRECDIQAGARAPPMAGYRRQKNPKRKYSFSGGRRRPP